MWAIFGASPLCPFSWYVFLVYTPQWLTAVNVPAESKQIYYYTDENGAEVSSSSDALNQCHQNILLVVVVVGYRSN